MTWAAVHFFFLFLFFLRFTSPPPEYILWFRTLLCPLYIISLLFHQVIKGKMVASHGKTVFTVTGYLHNLSHLAHMLSASTSFFEFCICS